eukprot:gene7424-biopygen18044
MKDPRVLRASKSSKSMPLCTEPSLPLESQNAHSPGVTGHWRGHGAGMARACPVPPTGGSGSGRGPDAGRARATR